MFDDDGPRIFGQAPGVDFPRAIVDGLTDRLAGRPPEDWARITLIVNTERMQRRLRILFDAGPARLLPRIRLLTALDDDPAVAHVPPAVPPLQRRLDLVALVGRLLSAEPELAPRTSLFDLADSLAALMDEMQGEGVDPAAIADLDVSDQSGHWDRAQRFLGIVQGYFDDTRAAPDAEARRRRFVRTLAATWRKAPPPGPVILAGSTGSRGTTLLLMQAIAALPQGAVVLPGFDFDMPHGCWDDLENALSGEDHPQYRFARILRTLGIGPAAVRPWHDAPVPAPDRNRVMSLALRPAPVTDAWLTEGPSLPPLDRAFSAVTMVEADSSREEALAIALRLRQAAEDGQSAALITPDRILTRQVTAALDRWHILPDDSAGTPLHLSPPGRFLRHVAALFGRSTQVSALLELLKHPLCHSGEGRAQHLLLTRELELHLRRYGPPFPDAADLALWAADQKHAGAAAWAAWVARTMTGQAPPGAPPLTDWVARHTAIAAEIAAGPDATGSGRLWDGAAGRMAEETMRDLHRHAGSLDSISAADYADLFGAVLAGETMRDGVTGHPHILIWGTLEARVQGADLLILGSLNEGTWPETPAPDPWLNRAMRHRAGLLLPERRTGLAAHDFQQAMGAQEVWITRAIRSDDAQTVPSRWINRLSNLLRGLPGQGGGDTLDRMRARGHCWLARVAVLEAVTPVPPARRPSPRPPLAARPDALPVTQIRHLIRDPYAIHARHVLGLRPLDPVDRAPDAMMRGVVLHKVLERFVKATRDDPAALDAARLIEIARETLKDDVAWPSVRVMWEARLARIADWFVETEHRRRALARPARFEVAGAITLPDTGFTLTAKADRVDLTPEGRIAIYDYKTGNPPTPRQQELFDKQLLLEAVIAQTAGFGEIAAARVETAVYIGLGTAPTEVPAPLDDVPVAQVRDEFAALVRAYADPGQGYTARRAMLSDRDVSDYDHLSRFGEWDVTGDPAPETLT